MPVISDKPLSRICVRIWEDDNEHLERSAALQNVPKNLLIREILRSYVAHEKAAARDRIDIAEAIDPTKITVEIPLELIHPDAVEIEL